MSEWFDRLVAGVRRQLAARPEYWDFVDAESYDDALATIYTYPLAEEPDTAWVTIGSTLGGGISYDRIGIETQVPSGQLVVEVGKPISAANQGDGEAAAAEMRKQFSLFTEALRLSSGHEIDGRRYVYTITEMDPPEFTHRSSMATVDKQYERWIAGCAIDWGVNRGA